MTKLKFIAYGFKTLKKPLDYAPGTSSAERIGFNKLSVSTTCKLNVNNHTVADNVSPMNAQSKVRPIK